MRPPPSSPSAPIDAIAAELRACRICRDAPEFGPPLPHEPRPIVQVGAKARLCVAGQAPGTLVHASGRPFTDPSGRRLRDWLGLDEACFYDSSRVAIIPMGSCFPGQDALGGDLPPRRECAVHWRRRIFDALPALELVLAIGQYAQNWHLASEKRLGLSQRMLNWRAIFLSPRRPKILPLPHPSWRNNHWLKQNLWFETELLPVLRAEVARLTRDQPDGA